MTSLRRRAIDAAIWTTALTAAGTLIRVGSSMIMTRLLVPEVFGVVTLVGAIYVILNLFSDIGLRQCVIQNALGEDPEYLDTIWSLSALRGVFIAITSVVVAFVVGMAAASGGFPAESVYSHPDLPLVLAWTGGSALLMGIKSPKLLVLERRLDFRKLAYIDALAQVFGTVVTVLATWLLRNVWGIVIGTYASVAASAVLSHVWIPGKMGRFRWNAAYVRQIADYGKWILISSIAFVLAVNADRLLLGLWISPVLLGFYGLALNISTAIEGVISRPFTSIAMPAFTELQRSGLQDFRAHYLRVRKPYDIATLLVSGALFVGAPFLIDVLYDERYTPAGITLQILSLSIVFQRFSVATLLHASLGAPEVGSIGSAIKLVSICVAIPVGYAFMGFNGAILGISLHMLPSVIYTFWASRHLKINDWKYETLVLLWWPAGAAIGYIGLYVLRVSGLAAMMGV